MYLLEPDLFNTINFVSSGVHTISRQLISLPNCFFHFMLNTDIVLSGFLLFCIVPWCHWGGSLFSACPSVPLCHGGGSLCFRPVLLSLGVMGEEVCFRLSRGVMGEAFCFRPVLFRGVMEEIFCIWPVLLSRGVMEKAFCFRPVLLSCGVVEEAFCFWPVLLSQKFVSTTPPTFWLGIPNYRS
jgi:hypothetical protein